MANRSITAVGPRRDLQKLKCSICNTGTTPKNRITAERDVIFALPYIYKLYSANRKDMDEAKW